MAERKVDWDKVHRQNYESRAFWDIHWIAKANDLLLSAKLIEPEVIKLWESFHAHTADKTKRILADHYQGTYFMLLAYAVENLLKGAIIRERSWEYKEHFRRTLKFPKELQSHNLIRLARKAGLEFSFEQEDLLRRLTRSATWYGRYPVPLLYPDSAGAETFSDGKEYAVSWFGGDDVNRLNLFIGKLKICLGISDADTG
jgi:hypothetical protein